MTPRKRNFTQLCIFIPNFRSAPNFRNYFWFLFHRSDYRNKTTVQELKIGSLAMALHSLSAPRRRLAKIRCLQECISCLSEGKPLPESVCYVPLELEYRCPNKTNIKLYASADTTKAVVKEVACTAESGFIVSGEELCNAQGKWLKVRKVGPVSLSSHLIYLVTARVVGAPQMILQPVSPIFPCSPLLPGTWQAPGLSIPWYCLPTSSSVCLVFFPLSLCLARWFWSDLMNGRSDL